MGKLPPEIGRIVEQLAGKVAAGEGGEWIADYMEFDKSVSGTIGVSQNDSSFLCYSN